MQQPDANAGLKSDGTPLKKDGSEALAKVN